MWLKNFFQSLTSTSSRRRRPLRHPRAARLCLEAVEDRCLLSNYIVTELGLQTAADINNHGQIAGMAISPSRAALWQDGVTIDLGGLVMNAHSYGTAISDAGHVVGESSLSGAFDYHAFLVTPEDTDQDGRPDRWFRDDNLDGLNDLMIDLGAPPGATSRALDVNAFGQVVGTTLESGSYGHSRAFVWNNGVMTDLGTLGGITSEAYAINDAGQVVGWSWDSSGSTRAFLINPEDTDGDGAPDQWYRDTNGDGANDLMVVLPGIAHNNFDLNAGGQVVGDAFLWTPDTPNGTTGTLTDLGNFSAYAINASAQVVGFQGEGVAGDPEHGGGGGSAWAALWEQGTAVDLNTRISGGPLEMLEVAVAINDHGWILATSSYDVPFLLTPDDQAPPPAPSPALTISDVTITEGNSGTRAAVFTVSLSEASSQTVTVNFATENGTATAGSDYQANSGTLTFTPGQLTQTISVPVVGDRLGEWNESFVVNLNSPTNAVVADGQGFGTILDDEPRISISDVTKAEGKNRKTTLFTFTVTLSAAYDQSVTMSFATVNGTATTSDNDYIAKSGTLTFAPGETTKTITIEVKGDNKKETNEYFHLDLFDNSANSWFTKSRGTGTILNDD